MTEMRFEARRDQHVVARFRFKEDARQFANEHRCVMVAIPQEDL